MGLLHFIDQGAGRPLVFIHGFCDTHHLWDDFIQPFTARFRVLCVDLPGFGKSELVPPPFTLDQVGDRLAGLFQELGLKRPIVVGHSLGGYVALSILEHHPQQLGGIVLFHSTAFADSEERKLVRDKVAAFVREHGSGPFLETFVPGLFADKVHPAISATRQRTAGTSAEALVAYAMAMRNRPDRSAVMASTDLPVLLLGGVLDALIPIQDLRKIKLLAPHAELAELPETGHMGMFEAKNEAQAILSSYIARVW